MVSDTLGGTSGRAPNSRMQSPRKRSDRGPSPRVARLMRQCVRLRVNQMQPPSVSEVIRTFSAMPGLQLVFFALAAVTWLGGGNILVAYHYKRVGKSAWSAFSSTLTGSSRTLIRD